MQTHVLQEEMKAEIRRGFFLFTREKVKQRM